MAHPGTGGELVAAARALAVRAHAGQVDEAGADHVTAHVADVARRLRGASDEAVAAAWLHDVLEDTAVAEEELRAQFPAEVVVDAVLALTHAPGEDRDEQGALRPVPGLGGRPQRTLSRPVTTWIGWMPSSAGSSKPSTWA